MKNVYANAANPGGRHLQENKPHLKGLFIVKSALRTSVTILTLSLFIFTSALAQNCPTTGTQVVSTAQNTYYAGTQATVAAGATSIALGAVGTGTNFGNTPIAAGDIILIIQMQGAQYTLPASTTNAVYGANLSGLGAGMITSNLQAGKMEFAVATNAVPVGGGTLNIAAGLTNTYNNTAYSSSTGKYTYQVIRVPQYFNIQLGATITAPKWNGTTGGVVVLSAVNNFDFNGNTVTALGAGFRGGGGRQLGGQTGLNKNDFYGASTNNAHGSKGEGIAGTPRYITVNSALVDNGSANEGYPGGSYARGGPGNAGGGGSDGSPNSNDQNSGGGGGGNGGAGGTGGNGWSSFTYTGGRGGTAFQTFSPSVTYYSPSRLIMGGGGGAASTNNGSGTPGSGAASGGSAGGGFVIINSSTISGTGTVNASGAAPNVTVTVDGSGGGGAGGSILIYANSGHSGITAIADGGDGADNRPKNLDATQHGPGGGGGGGVIFSNGALNSASSVNGGLAGISYGTSATDSYGSFPGSVGVLTQTFPFAQLPPNMQICQTTILPVTLLNFSANYESSNNVKIAWTTTNEVNASHFVVERSSDGSGFTSVAQVNTGSYLDIEHAYSVNDALVNVTSNTIYYRLRIVDLSGKYTYSKVVPVKLDQPKNVISVNPNPVDNYAVLNVFAEAQGMATMRLIDNSGKPIMSKSFNVSKGNNSQLIDQLGYLPKGIYIVQVMLNNSLYNQKIIKK